MQPLTGSKRIRVVSSPSMAEVKGADVSGYLVDRKSFLKRIQSCCVTTVDTSSSYLLRKEMSTASDGTGGGYSSRGSRLGLSHSSTGGVLNNGLTSSGSEKSSTTPEFRVQVPVKTSFRCGEHMKYIVKIRGDGPNGRSQGRAFSRVDGLKVWIRRQRWFSDGHGNEATEVDYAKQPQYVDFSGSAAGALPVEFAGSITVPLGIPPTSRGSILSNEYDLVVQVIVKGRECGTIDVPITVWRDAEGSFLSPAFSPSLAGVQIQMESAHGGDGVDDEDEEEESKMQQLALS